MECEVKTVRGRQFFMLRDEIIERERAARQIPGTMVAGPFGSWESHYLLQRAPERVRRQIELARRFPGIRNATSPFQTVEGQPSAAPASFTPVTSTSETNLWVPSIWTPIPANSMMAGKCYRIEFGGIFGTSSSAPTTLWTFRCGQSATPGSNISLGASTAVTATASLTAVPFYGTAIMVVRALGIAASGATATGNGMVAICAVTTTAAQVLSFGAAVPTTVDNTAATGLIMSHTYGTAQASNTLTCQMVTPVTSLN